MSDVFREVDEEVRREQFSKLWDQYGTYVIAVAVLIAVATAGFQWWTYSQERQRLERSEKFLTALELVAEKPEEGLVALEQLGAEGDKGYALLAQFRHAGLLVDQGKTDQALAAYDAISSSGADPLLSDLAKIRAAQLLTDTGSAGDIRARIGSLTTDANPWRFTARELLALVAFRDGDLVAARDAYQKLSLDLSAPQGVKSRANDMLAAIGPVAESEAATGAGGQEGDNAAPGAASPAGTPQPSP